MMVEEGEVLIACSDKSVKIGVTMWDLSTGDKMLHIPSCASPQNGLLCLRNRFLVASQLLHNHDSLGGGAIVVWPLNRPQKSLLNYTVEAIGPLSCTKDGIYLVGGALSGKAYLWDVTSGKLLKRWSAHHKTSVNCLLFSEDNSLLISGSEDGMICIWSMISLLEEEEMGSSPLYYLPGHMSSITGLLTTSGCYFPCLLSSSLDGTCKVWDFISGSHIHTQIYPLGITCIALHQDRFLFCGTKTGTIIVDKLDIGWEECRSAILVDQPLQLKGHNGAITTLTTSKAGLISASEDGTICIWDVTNSAIIRRLSFRKGRVTNLAVVPRSSALSSTNRRRVSNNEYDVSPLEKYPHLINSSEGTITLVSLCHDFKDKQTSIDLRSTGLLRESMPSSQKSHMPIAMAMQMKVDTDIESRSWATKMAKHVMTINKHLKTLMVKLMQERLLVPTPETTNLKRTRVKKLAIQAPLQEEENQITSA